MNVLVEECGDGEFKCKNEKCISLNETCNSNNDCGDNTDEHDCESIYSSI